MDIIIDTTGQADLIHKDQLVESDEGDVDFGDVDTNPLNVFEVDFNETKKNVVKKKKRGSSKDINLDEFERDMGWRNTRPQTKLSVDVVRMAKELTPLDKVLQKSVIKPGFEQLETVPTYEESKRQLQAKRRREKAKTTGKMWYNMPAPEVTDEIKHDLEVLQMRSVLDPKHFYKKNDLKALPKYFQIGKVVDSPLDYYSGRLTNKERKKTIVDELMADAEFAKYNKRKYKEIIDQKKKTHYKAHKHAKRLKGKKGKK